MLTIIQPEILVKKKKRKFWAFKQQDCKLQYINTVEHYEQRCFIYTDIKGYLEFICERKKQGTYRILIYI